LPDPSVSHRHATLRAQGHDFVLIDEGSTNGTFVGSVRVAARTSRIVRSGDQVRIGRIWLELRIDQSPITRDVASATRDLALALVSQVLESKGADGRAKVRVVEGRDQGASLSLVDEERTYLIGRDANCDLPLADADVSRQHVRVIRRGGSVFVRDLGTKNGTCIGDTRLLDEREVGWRPRLMMKIGRTVLALEEPLAEALADLEDAPDEHLRAEEMFGPPVDSTGEGRPTHGGSPPLASGEPVRAAAPPRSSWSTTDVLVMAAALGVLALSLAGLVWLLKG
jgi:pSer/pThr/pTyr-binding forkhead associated (FHA) protein